MKINKVRESESGALQTQLTEQGEQMFRLKMQMKMGQTEGLKKMRELRKDRARILTVLRERETAK
ncbi:MAG: 50S ribosomal protein L29 [Bryobacteraceae bacterium]